MMPKDRRITKELIIAALLWLSVPIGILLAWRSDISVSEKLPAVPSGLVVPDALQDRFSVDNASSTMTYRFRFSKSYQDRDEILKLSSEPGFAEAVNALFDSRHWWLWYLLPIGWLLLVGSFEAYHGFTKRNMRSFFEKAFDYRIVLAFFAFTCFFTFSLFQIGMLSSSEHAPGFLHARAEFFLTWGVFLAIVGAFYAVFAKRRADASFDKGEEIYQNITGFFTNYEDIFNEEDNRRSIPRLIERSKRSLTFFLGSPLVGYFRDEQLGNAFYTKLLAKINTNTVQTDHKFEIDFLCWSDEYCKQYYLNHNGTDFEEKRNTLIRAVQSLHGSRGRVFHPKDDRDSVFRFVIADEREAIFWLLEDPTPQAASRERESGPRGGGFTSDREQMVRILRNLFDYTSKDRRPDSPTAPASGGTPEKPTS